MFQTALKSRKIESSLNSLQSLRRIGAFGLMMGASILAGYYLGSYIDRLLGTYPLFMMVLIILCIVGGFIQLFRDAGVLGAGKESVDKRLRM